MDMTREAPQNPSRVVSWLVAAGSVLIVLGGTLLAVSNWMRLDRPWKVLIVYAVVAGTTVAGAALQNRRPGVSQGFYFLGALAFGGAIWVVAGIFQMPWPHANGVFFWILGILPAAVLFRAPAILRLAAVLSPVWLIAHAYADPAPKPFFAYLPLQAVILGLAYVERRRFALVLAAIGGALWMLHFQHAQYGWMPASPRAVLLASNVLTSFGFFLYALGIFHRVDPFFGSFATPYKILGMTFFMGGAYILTIFRDPGLVMPASHGGPYYFSGTGLLIYSLYTLAAALGLRQFMLSRREARQKEGLALTGFVLAQLVFMHVWFAGAAGVWIPHNVILAAEILVFLYVGVLLREEPVVRTALLFLAVTVLTRFFEAFWVLLPQPLFFLSCGALLVVGGLVLDRQRRRLERLLKEGEKEVPA